MAEKSSILGTITKIILIGGAIILFALLVIWILQWIPKAINGVADVGSDITNELRGGELIEVALNQEEINSGQPFAITFEHTPSKPGEYYLIYSCAESLILDIQSTNGPKRILCNTPFKIGENIDAISLVPTLTKTNVFTDTNIEIFFKDYENNERVASGNTVATIKNISGETTANNSNTNPFDANLAGSTVTSSPTENSQFQRTNTQSSNSQDNGLLNSLIGNGGFLTTVTNTGTSNTNQNVSYNYGSGRADLVITNIAETAGRSALSFTVYNYGSRSTGNWYFSYTDAENPNRTLTSPIQPSLAPGQGLFIQVAFDFQRYSNQNVSVYIDSTNSVSESNESNNRTSVIIDGRTDGNYSFGGNYYGYGDYDRYDDADLVIDDLEVGRISGSRFIEDDEIDEDDDAGVRFTVRNRGGESTGSWRFEITNTPYDNDDDYRSNRYGSLRPGQEIEIIVELENPDEGNYNIRVEVDSDDDVDEENERNNTESERLEVRD